MMSVFNGFTHVDPFEDTESCQSSRITVPPVPVSPTSIRSRILKGLCVSSIIYVQIGFTHVDPFEDTERCNQVHFYTTLLTVSPTSIRSRILKDDHVGCDAIFDSRFTHVDPFEDTESPNSRLCNPALNAFHPRRSVRGY